MKVLFVCQANMGRSQMAQALFESISKHQAESAGTMVGEKDGQTLEDFARERTALGLESFTIQVMRGEGIDISGRLRTQLTSGMVDDADKVIVITEPSSWPDYLTASKKVDAWDIIDPAGMEQDFVANIKDIVKTHVEELIKEID